MVSYPHMIASKAGKFMAMHGLMSMDMMAPLSSPAHDATEL